jgi:hypothetical protein
MKVRRGLPEFEGDNPTSEAQWNYERLIARVTSQGAWILVYVLDRTQSGFAGLGIPPGDMLAGAEETLLKLGDSRAKSGLLSADQILPSKRIKGISGTRARRSRGGAQ